jgi:hypothetical protein
MNDAIHRWLQEIERAYYDETPDDDLCEMVCDAVGLIRRLDRRDEIRDVCELLAPTLWGADSGSELDTHAVRAALDGPDRMTYLHAWSGLGRAILAHRLAA